MWREKVNLGRRIERVDQVELNFSSLCPKNSSDDLCYIDYTIPNELKVVSEDFIGFYTDNNSLARPSFFSAGKNTIMYVINSTNTSHTNSERSHFIRHRPMKTYDLQMIGTYVSLYKQFL